MKRPFPYLGPTSAISGMLPEAMLSQLAWQQFLEMYQFTSPCHAHGRVGRVIEVKGHNSKATDRIQVFGRLALLSTRYGPS